MRIFAAQLWCDTVVTTWGRHGRIPTLVALMAPLRRWMREGIVTASLQSASAGPAVRFANIYGFAAITGVLILMGARPFY